MQNIEDIGTELLSSVVDSSLPLLLRFLRLKELNEFLKLPSLPQRFHFRSTVKHYFKKLPKMLTHVGDYDFQASIVEAVFRMTNSEYRRREVTKWFPKLDCKIHSLFIRIRDFDPDVRRFLNAYNKCLGPDQLVFSFPCDCVSMGQVALVKPKVATYDKFWIDFNLGTCSILIICHKDWVDEDSYESVWEPLMIKVQDIVKATLVQTVHSFTLEIVLPSVEACVNLFFSQASQEFEKLLTDTIVLEFPPQKNLARICKTTFEDKLKNSAEELDCWMANGSRGSLPFSGEKVSSSSSRQKKRTSSAHGLKAYQNTSSKESKTDSSTVNIKKSSDEHERVPARKKRRRSRNVSHILSCTDSSELVEERPNNSKGKAVRDQYVSPLLHSQKKNYLSSHSKKRTLESVVQQDLKVVIPDSQDYEEIPGNFTDRFIEDADVIPCSLNCQEQQKLSSFGCKTSVNIFPIMRKIESVTQVDLEVDVVEDESELKVGEKSCKKMLQNYEEASSPNADMVNVNLYDSNIEGNRKQLSTSKFEFDKKQTMKNGKCSLANSPLNMCSISKSVEEPVNMCPYLESSEPPPQSSTSGVKLSEIIIEKKLKKNQEISILRKVQEDKHSVSDEEPLDNRISVPSPNPYEELLGNKTTIPPTPSPVEEMLDNGSTIPPVRQEGCENSVNTTYNPVVIAKSQLQKTDIVPEIKHCNSFPIDTEMKHLLFKSCTSANSAPATPNVERLSVAKPFLTQSISDSLLRGDGSRNLVEDIAIPSKV
ncbi:synaptonemal complex protein 2-like [Macrobrachium rosenbergii]|uniref:synaptonemal complex protein 2-like n=1 Tax=Macrobrachium rosenbergii TaxID=79674 RepID=UPI0034D48982